MFTISEHKNDNINSSIQTIKYRKSFHRYAKERSRGGKICPPFVKEGYFVPFLSVSGGEKVAPLKTPFCPRSE